MRVLGWVILPTWALIPLSFLLFSCIQVNFYFLLRITLGFLCRQNWFRIWLVLNIKSISFLIYLIWPFSSFKNFKILYSCIPIQLLNERSNTFLRLLSVWILHFNWLFKRSLLLLNISFWALIRVFIPVLFESVLESNVRFV